MALATIVALIYVFLFTPIVTVIVLSFGQSISVISLSRLTTRWYAQLANNDEAIAAFWFSLRLGLASAVLALTIGTMAAFGIVRQRFRGKWLLQAMLFSPMVVPEIIIAVALLSFFAFLRIPRGWPALVIGHTVLLLPYVISVVSAKLYGFDRSLEEAAQNLGAPRWRSFIEVTLPLMAPAMVGAALIAFKVSFDEVVGSVFWSSLRERTLPVVVFAMLNWELTPQVNAIGTLMTAVTLAILAVFQLTSLRRQRSSRN
ncbi:MAG: ABC transporter permease [Proteobacteria bacterium]|nr:ABC transporter permease [Pseudomonadota bacterium]